MCYSEIHPPNHIFHKSFPPSHLFPWKWPSQNHPVCHLAGQLGPELLLCWIWIPDYDLQVFGLTCIPVEMTSTSSLSGLTLILNSPLDTICMALEKWWPDGGHSCPGSLTPPLCGTVRFSLALLVRAPTCGVWRLKDLMQIFLSLHWKCHKSQMHCKSQIEWNRLGIPSWLAVEAEVSQFRGWPGKLS